MNTAWGIAIVRGLVAAGLREAVVCPGSRSTPLALALEAHPDVRTTVLIDERSAGFFALGAAKATGRPVAVCTTSGTAVANLLPAAVEAAQTHTCLILLTADRPRALRGTGANQTIDQVGLFGVYARTEDLPEPEAALLPGLARRVEGLVAQAPRPLHLNVPLPEPLEPDAPGQALLAALPEPARPPAIVASSLTACADSLPAVPATTSSSSAAPPDASPRLEGPGAIVVGPRRRDAAFAEAVHDLAARLGAPLLADALSGVRHGAGVVVSSHDAFLTSPEVRAALAPRWVLQFGASPTSKALRRWLAEHPVPRWKVDEDGRGWNDVPGDVRFVRGDATAFCHAVREAGHATEAWEVVWRRVDAAARDALDQARRERPGLEPDVLPAVAQACQAATLFVGNSLPVRDLDRFVPGGVSVLSNRGASGIDGLLSTAAGATVAGPVIAVVGDLSFQHDLGGLAALRAVRPRLRLVVIGNGGGRIFDHLPIAHATQHFERLFTTPQNLDVPRAVEAFGLRCATVGPDGIAASLQEADVVHVVVDGEASVALRDEAARRAAQAALEELRGQ